MEQQQQQQQPSSASNLIDIVVKILVAIITAALIGLFSFLKDVPNEDKVREMIRREAPYLQDKKAINQNVITNTKVISKLSDSITTLNIQLSDLRGELRIMRELNGKRRD